MTTTEHLQKIKSECERLLAFAERATVSNYFTCEGRCEAGWRSTIAAINLIFELHALDIPELTITKTIIAAWPIELLQ
jgi:hypothetical protein